MPKTFRVQKAVHKTPTTSFCKAVFVNVLKGIKIEITGKFLASGRVRFEDKKRIISPEMRPKSFGTLENRFSRMEIAG